MIPYFTVKIQFPVKKDVTILYYVYNLQWIPVVYGSLSFKINYLQILHVTLKGKYDLSFGA